MGTRMKPLFGLKAASKAEVQTLAGSLGGSRAFFPPDQTRDDAPIRPTQTPAEQQPWTAIVLLYSGADADMHGSLRNGSFRSSSLRFLPDCPVVGGCLQRLQHVSGPEGTKLPVAACCRPTARERSPSVTQLPLDRTGQ